jgi:spoIIIJ-associated protein
MKTAEASGKTLDEALSNGRKVLGVIKDEIDYEVIAQTPEETKVKITIKEPRLYLTALTSYLLETCGFRANILVIKDTRGFHVNIKTKQAHSILIGTKGETLWALQYLISRLAKRFYPNLNILVDVNNYRLKRNSFLKKKAEAIAHIVIQTGKEMALDPLTKREEQLVLEALTIVKGIKTYTLGKGTNRNIIIAPESGPT